MTPHRPRAAPQTLRPRRHADDGVHAACAVHRAGHDHCPGRGQRIPGPARRPDDCRDVPGGGHRHGGAARVQRIDSRRKHRAHGGVDRRIRRGGRDLHGAGVRDREGVAVVQPGGRVLEIDRAHDDGRRAGRALLSRWCGACWWKIPNCHFRNRWRRARFTRRGSAARRARNILFWNMGFGGLVYMLSALRSVRAPTRISSSRWANLGRASCGSRRSGGQALGRGRHQ